MCKLKPHEQAFIDKLYEQHYNALLKYARSFLDSSNAEEAVQNVFMDACIKIDEIITYDKPIGWLVRALQFSISKTIRRKKQFSKMIICMAQRAEPEFGREFGMEDFPDKRPVDEDVDILYGDLKMRKEFQLIKKFAIDGKSVKEIAEEENTTVSACNQRLYRYREKLRKILREQTL